MSVVTLAYRQFNKQDSYFLVQYEEDDILQVRGRGFLRTDEKVRYSGFFFRGSSISNSLACINI